MQARTRLCPRWTRCGGAFVPMCALLLANFGASAAEPVARGFYLGGLVGPTEFDDDGLAGGRRFDDSDTGYVIYGGYKFFRYLAVEARLADLGSYRIKDVFFDGTTNADIDASGLSAHVIGIIPFGRSGWELFGQLGLGVLQIDTNCCGDDDEVAGSAGIGVRFYPTPRLGISLQTDAYIHTDASYYGLYTMGVTATQLGVQYVF